MLESFQPVAVVCTQQEKTTLTRQITATYAQTNRGVYDLCGLTWKKSRPRRCEHMNKPQTIEGKWWVHGKDNPGRFGVLCFDPENGLDLTVKISQDRSSDEALISVFDGCCNSQHVPQIIRGTNEHNLP